MKVVLLSTAMLALASSAIAKPVPEDGAINKVPISWSDVESGPHNAQHAHQGEAHNHDLHARAPGKMSKAEFEAEIKAHAQASGMSEAELLAAMDKNAKAHSPALAALAEKDKLHARSPGKSGAEGSGVNRAGRPKADHKIEDSNPMNQWKRDEVDVEARDASPGWAKDVAGKGKVSHHVAFNSMKRDPRINTANANNVNAAAAAAAGGECEGAGSGCFGDVTHYVSSVPLDTL